MDTLTPQERSQRMARVRSGNTKPEMAVRRALHALGYRYQLRSPGVPGRPDLVFPKRRKVIFVHGCFWHRHDCKMGNRTPKTRLDFWVPKLEGNATRDAATLERLRAMGWDALIVWECEVPSLAEQLPRITSFLGPPR
ncbi:MAG TPA: very short patch repair endonuclease [Longimicrobium sp.]|nr:very short patch repair endonuclease [Longimicrobium sp.]